MTNDLTGKEFEYLNPNWTHVGKKQLKWQQPLRVSNENIIHATSSKSHLPCRTAIGSAKSPTQNLKVTIQRYILNRKITPGTNIDANENDKLEPTLAEILEKKSIEEAAKQLFKQDGYKTFFNQENAKNRSSFLEPNTIVSVKKEDYQSIYRRGSIKTQLNVEEQNPLDRTKGKKVEEKIPDAHTENDIIPPINTETPTTNVNKQIEKERKRQLSFKPDVKVLENENGDTPLYRAKTENIVLRDDTHSRVSSHTHLKSQNVQEVLKCVHEDVVTVPHKLTENKMEEKSDWRRQCGCLKTSDKLKQLLKRFPSPPAPPPPSPSPFSAKFEPSNCISAYCTKSCYNCDAPQTYSMPDEMSGKRRLSYTQTISTNVWHATYYVVSLVQLSVTTTALALYYIIYFYMQLVYYMLLSAMFFHNADGPMKITIGVVAVTSIIVGFNLLLRMERMVGFTINE